LKPATRLRHFSPIVSAPTCGGAGRGLGELLAAASSLPLSLSAPYRASSLSALRHAPRRTALCSLVPRAVGGGGAFGCCCDELWRPVGGVLSRRCASPCAAASGGLTSGGCSTELWRAIVEVLSSHAAPSCACCVWCSERDL
jgi:hypothetical protein